MAARSRQDRYNPDEALGGSKQFQFSNSWLFLPLCLPMQWTPVVGYKACIFHHTHDWSMSWDALSALAKRDLLTTDVPRRCNSETNTVAAIEWNWFGSDYCNQCVFPSWTGIPSMTKHGRSLLFHRWHNKELTDLIKASQPSLRSWEVRRDKLFFHVVAIKCLSLLLPVASLIDRSWPPTCHECFDHPCPHLGCFG